MRCHSRAPVNLIPARQTQIPLKMGFKITLNTSKFYSQLLAPPPHPWTTVAHFKIAHAVLTRDLSDLRQFAATLLSEEAQILDARVKEEYPTDAKRAEAMETYQKEFDVLRDILNHLDEYIKVMTVFGIIVTWNDENRGMGTVWDFWVFTTNESYLFQTENLDRAGVGFVYMLLEEASFNWPIE
ncbi:hypothetical protein RUND412_003731 [Rhizina undulata]